MPVQRIFMVSPEFYGYYHSGGLGMAVSGLANALAERGAEVTVAVPKYSLGSNVDANPKINVVLIEGNFDSFRGYEGYSSHHSGYTGNDERPAHPEQFSSAVKFAREVGKHIKGIPSDKAPDVVHIHDWHSSLVPYMLGELGIKIPTLLTIHNALYTCPLPSPESRYQHDFPLSYSIMKDGRVYRSVLEFGVASSTRVNTVSPTYASELRKGQNVGIALHEALVRKKSLIGILNGIDSRLMNPMEDPHISNYDPTNPHTLNRGKGANKLMLQTYFGLPKNDRDILVSMMGRPTKEKGIEVILDAAQQINQTGGLQLLVVGDAQNDARLLERMRMLGGNIKGVTSFADSELQHRILAGSDAIIMPSISEPCGLVQLEAMRYGAVPIVTKTGGLQDTVVSHGQDGGYGIVIGEPSPASALMALREAVALFGNPESWTQLAITAAKQDFSWNGPKDSLGKYIKLYERLARPPRKA